MEKNKINKKLLVIIIAILVILLSLVFVVSFFDLIKVEEKVSEKVEEKEASYPQDYTLKEDEIPESFELENMDKSRMNRMGLKENPGFIYNSEYLNYLYSGVNPSKIDKLYTSSYENTNTDNNLGLMAVKYNSIEDLEGEKERIKKDTNNRKIYLRKGEVLVIIWCDDKNDVQKMSNVGQNIKERLGLSEL